MTRLAADEKTPVLKRRKTVQFPAACAWTAAYTKSQWGENLSTFHEIFFKLSGS